MKKLVSIIITSYNEEKNISSVVKDCQKLKKFFTLEIIVVDGGSKDMTIKILKKYKNKNNKIIIKKDKNLWEGINNGIKASSGQIICVLNSDDYFYKDALKIIYDYFKKDKKLSYVFGSVKKNNRILYRLKKKKYSISSMFILLTQLVFSLKKMFKKK